MYPPFIQCYYTLGSNHMNHYAVRFYFRLFLDQLKTAFHHEVTEEQEEKQCIIRP